MIFAVLFGLFMGITSGILAGIGTASIMLTFYAILVKMEIHHLFVAYLTLIVSSQYMATLTAIYTGVPGSESAFPTAKESHNLIDQNLTREAVAQNAIASLLGNTVGLVLIAIFLPLSIYIMSVFGAVVQGVILASSILIVTFTSDHRFQAMVLICAGMFLSSLGFDENTYTTFNLGLSFLDNGLSWVSLVMGSIIGYSIRSMGKGVKAIKDEPLGLFAGFQSMKGKWPSALRGAFFGFFIGLVPALSYILSSTVCYQIENKLKHDNDNARVLKSLISSDAAHCSGTIAMLLPLLAFSIPITAGEGVIYNIITMTSTTKDLMTWINANILTIGAVLLFVNFFSMVVAWKFGNLMVRLLSIPPLLLKSLVFCISLFSVVYISNMTGDVTISIVTYLITAVIFYALKLNPLPFIFSILIYGVSSTVVHSIGQLYF